MANLFSNTQLKVVENLLIDMFDTYSKNVRLYYQPKIVDCSCTLKFAGSTDNQANFWQHGGIIGPNNPECNLCGGRGKKQEEYTEDIKLVINWFDGEPKEPTPNTYINNGILVTRGKISDFPKVQQTVKMRLLDSMLYYDACFYELDKGASDQFSILKDKWFIAKWKRVS